MRSLAAVLALSALAPPFSYAQLTPEQAISIKQIRGVHWSPDGRRIAFTLSQPPIGRQISQDIWVTDGQAADPVQFTKNGSSFMERWSPDGKQIAFLSSLSGPPQVYVMPANGGDPVQLTNHGSAIREFAWSPDSKTIAFLANENRSEPEDPRRIYVVSGTNVPQRIWIADVATKKERQLTRGAFSVSEIDWKPDSSGLVAVATDQPNPEKFNSHLYSISLADGSFDQIAAPKGPIEKIAVSPDGKTVAYVGAEDGPSGHDLYAVPIGGGEAKDLTADIDRTVDTFFWRDKTTMMVMVENGYTNKLYTVTTTRKNAPVDGFDVNASSMDISRSGDVAYVREASNELAEVWLQSKGHRAGRKLTAVNAGFPQDQLAKAELIKYKSSDGTEIEAQMFRPKGPAGKKFPTIAMCHGGPVLRFADHYDVDTQFLVSHGYAVILPNIRGSSSYGHHMIELIRSAAHGGSGWATGTLNDVLAGLDEMIRLGIADPNRQAMGGFSFGGYMVLLGLSRSDRFRAGVAGAGFYDMVSDLSTEVAAYVPGDEWMYGDFFSPATQVALREDSPIGNLSKVKAPVLLWHGELDPMDPVAQSYQLFRGLQHNNVTTELYIYPGEGHGLRQGPHNIDRLNRTLAWYEKYLMNAAGSSN